ncbi:Hypothetical Protein SiL_2188 [Sulfolobus islandicus LAL14/1]|uniref:Uncharacterized protein n=1 Tax=Saccharolobus islandicus LAL14/1 TaxID=1241935 RepID=M9UG62_SACIS|nr:Hypothetical Protein SiL_2188 [Sulfolobus islandicus LAL14/1]
MKFRKYCEMLGTALVADVIKANSSEFIPKYADTNDMNGFTRLFARFDKIAKSFRYFNQVH